MPFELDPLRALDVPEGASVLRRYGDGTLALWREDRERGTLEMLAWNGIDEPRTVWSCSACRTTLHQRTPEYEEVLLVRWDPEQTEVWRFTFAGEPPLRLGSRLYAQEVLDDGRILAVLVDETHDRGPLLLTSGPDDAVLLAADVDVRSILFTIGLETPGEVAYAAVEADGASTLHRARLAPR
jgi:hypothetical protein